MFGHACLKRHVLKHGLIWFGLHWIDLVGHILLLSFFYWSLFKMSFFISYIGVLSFLCHVSYKNLYHYFCFPII